jgi:Tfp pilus assembly protein PilZ
MPDGGEPIELACKVIWTNKYGKETQDLRRGMGIKFLRLQPEVQKRIEEYIQSHKDKNLLLKN